MKDSQSDIIIEEACATLEILYPAFSERVKSYKKLQNRIFSLIKVPIERDELEKQFQDALKALEPQKKFICSFLPPEYYDEYANCKNSDISATLALLMNDYIELSKPVEEMWTHTKETFVQTKLMEMYGDMSEFRGHVRVKKDTSPSPISSSRDFPLPPEIMRLVYYLLPLETCVILRQVSTAWYSVFHDSSDILSNKLHQRNSWIRPGDGDLRTWQDCVLVFVQRMKNAKWTWSRDLDIADISSDNKSPQKTVVATELKTYLPSGFTRIGTYVSKHTKNSVDFFNAKEAGELFPSWNNQVLYLIDYRSRRLIKYVTSTLDHSKGCETMYNGQVWIYNETKKILVPTFVDLWTQKLYYRPDRIITGVEARYALNQGSRKNGFEQFMVAYGSKSSIVDMATGLVTVLSRPYLVNHGSSYRIGFVDGELEVFYETNKEPKEDKESDKGVGYVRRVGNI